jgi:hypothetical protein
MKPIKSVTAILAAIIFITSSCQKNNSSPKDDTQLQASVSQNAADEYNVQSGEQFISEDANTAVAVNPSFAIASGGTMDNSLIAGATVDKSLITALVKKIKIIYNGVAVLGVTRTGNITVELVSGNNWVNAGAVLKITVDNLKVSYLGRSWIYNGTGYIKNVSGGLAFIGPDIVVHAMRVNGAVTFDDNSTLTWWSARKNSYHKNDLSFSSEGDTLINGATCTMGGINRYGTAFLVKAPQAIVSNAICGFDKPVAGTRILATDNRNTTIAFGVNENGNSVSNGDCAYGYKIDWTTLSGQNATLIISY